MLKLKTFKIGFISYSHILLLLTAALLLPGCSAVPLVEPEDAEPTMHSVDSIVRDDVQYPIDVYDPWEGMNRNIYIFNAELDHYVMMPVVHGYRQFIPHFLRQGVYNFFRNLASINHTINSALQLNPDTTVNNGMRFISNTTIGLAGVFDIATQMGFPEIKEDLGQTLGYWGVGDGPYIVLPAIGPSNLRDTTGFVGDILVYSWFLKELGMNGNEGWLYFYYVMNAVNLRAHTPFEYYQTGSPFEYEMIRWLYTSGRKAMIAR